MIFGSFTVLEFGYGANRETMIIEVPIETFENTLMIDTTQDGYGTFIEATFESIIESSLGLEGIDVDVLTVDESDTAKVVITYEINIYANSSETRDSIETVQDQMYKDALDEDNKLLIGGSITDFQYPQPEKNPVYRAIIVDGAEAKVFTGPGMGLGGFRRNLML